MIREQSNDPQWPTLIVTGGNLLFEREQLTPSSAGTAKIAANGVLQASQKMGATFAGVGTRDLAAGIGLLKASHRPAAFSWLSLNLVDPATHKPLFAPMIQRQVGTTKIAVLALTDHTALSGDTKEFQALDWRTALPPVLAKAEQEADFILLLSNYSFSENQEIAKKSGTIDLILQTGHVAGNMAPIPINKSLLAQTEIRGKYVGIMDIDWHGRAAWSEAGQPVPDKDQPVSTYANQFVPLYQSLAVAPDIEAVIKQTKQQIERLRQGQTP
ncbi:MAG: hypothetical protein LBD10_01585 [Desulfobulbus sp.]|uniref:hypothetical protein n=1 Tax=Desulfobulbus sp. TaxID=895 RepID=UPI0028442D44|nr:hypothetical protein [Desulfobulbus sp.]MDR2548888.1 hypothetical protein [Desulfobulbus sp.]